MKILRLSLSLLLALLMIALCACNSLGNDPAASNTTASTSVSSNTTTSVPPSATTGGNGGSSPLVSFVVDNVVFDVQSWDTLELPTTNPNKAGYTFAGWYFDKDTWNVPLDKSLTAYLSITQNTSVYAKFTPVTYTITYVLDEGISNTNPTSYTIETPTITLASPERSGYTFDGWYKGNTRVTTIEKGSTGALTLVARWSNGGAGTGTGTGTGTGDSGTNGGKCTVTFLANGGTGTMDAVTLTKGAEALLPLNTLTKTNYLFAGWKDANGNIYRNGQDVQAAIANADTLTLTAQWRGMQGFDISTWQEDGDNIHYSTLAPISNYWIIRAGFGSSTKDNEFENHYAAAKRYGVPVGAYWYAYAETYEQGVAEAEYCYEYCLKGKQFEFPIFLDVEDSSITDASYNNLTQAVIGFCETLISKGYYPGIYTGKYWDYYMDLEQLSARYDLWVAGYYSDNSYNHELPLSSAVLWQYTDKYAYENTTLDANMCYKDFETTIKYFGMNGFTSGGGTFKTYMQLAQEVLNAKWDAGDARKVKLTAAGYDYTAVQRAVAWLLNHPNT